MRLFRNLFLMMVIPSILFVSGCNKDDEPDPTTQKLIGVWQADEISLGASVDGVSLDQYLLNQGYTEQEASDILNLFANIIALGYSGTIEFKSDNTFTSTLGGSVETGTWMVVNGGNDLQMTSDTETTVWVIKSIGAAQLVLGLTDTYNEDDLNNDGTNEQVDIEVELTFVKPTS